MFIKNLPNTSNDEAAELLKNWVISNYENLNIDKSTIDNYIDNASFLMQVVGITHCLGLHIGYPLRVNKMHHKRLRLSHM